MIESGVNALDLLDSASIQSGVFVRAVAALQSNYGTEYSQEKVALLFDMIREDGWSEERFTRTLKWFLKTRPFAAWTIADWFSYGVKLYPYAWYLEQVSKNGASVNKQIESYRLPDGIIAYRYADGEELPFEKL